ncbi:CLUMA_CG014634, isoform A [Clunio marinus]|uniref:CLUMA_CG014634, isoform A n=1 Tax=Clunio marinus TaxID=568069 RepID=A0A1J1IMI0_9DIPT|nr:CLUMA_CG014634, isoform A [Clunio marinus]
MMNGLWIFMEIRVSRSDVTEQTRLQTPPIVVLCIHRSCGSFRSTLPPPLIASLTSSCNSLHRSGST